MYEEQLLIGNTRPTGQVEAKITMQDSALEIIQQYEIPHITLQNMGITMAMVQPMDNISLLAQNLVSVRLSPSTELDIQTSPGSTTPTQAARTPGIAMENGIPVITMTRRAKIIMKDIVQNGTSSDGDHLLNWQDIAQRVAKDASGKEKGTGSYSYAGQIACGYSRSSVVSVAGNTSLNSSIHMSWVGIGQTTQIAIFLPLYAGNLHSSK